MVIASNKHLSFLVTLTAYVLLYTAVISPIVSTKLCIFGDGPDCTFKCHCNGDSTGGCDPLTGRCPNGCQKGKPLLYGDWRSDGCQLSNVAYGKPTFSNTAIEKSSKNYNRPHLWYNTNYTVDGSMKLRVFDGSCTVVYTTNKTTLPWMMVDLQKQYVIPKVTLVNTDNSIDSSYLEDFYIKVGNTTNMTEQAVCKKYYTRIRSAGKQTITCTKPLIGRYVTIEKYEERNKVGRLPLCEFIVFGYNPIEVEWEKCYEKSAYNMYCKKCIGTIPPDCLNECPENSYGMYCEGICGQCKDGEKCDSITGKCDTCELGWKPPRCDTPCPNNTYGYGCTHDCGKCAGNEQCDIESGVCPSECIQWYADEDKRCNTTIPLKNIEHLPKILFVKETWAMLVIPDTINPTIRTYYKFKLFYLHENNPLAHLEDYDKIKVNYDRQTDNKTKEIKIEIDGLLPHTQYWFILQIFRQHHNLSEGGQKSAIMKIMTLNRNGQNNNNNDNNQNKPSNTQNLIRGNTGNVKTSKSTSLHHHVSTVTIVLNLVVVAVLAVVGIVVGVFLYRKYRGKHENNLPKQNRAEDPVNYNAHSEMITDYDDIDYHDTKKILGN